MLHTQEHFGTGYADLTFCLPVQYSTVTNGYAVLSSAGSRGDPEAAAGEHGGGERGGHAGQPGGRHTPHARRRCRSLSLRQVTHIFLVSIFCSNYQLSMKSGGFARWPNS
jgi:hypothetical protein